MTVAQIELLQKRALLPHLTARQLLRSRWTKGFAISILTATILCAPAGGAQIESKIASFIIEDEYPIFNHQPQTNTFRRTTFSTSARRIFPLRKVGPGVRRPKAQFKASDSVQIPRSIRV